VVVEGLGRGRKTNEETVGREGFFCSRAEARTHVKRGQRLKSEEKGESSKRKKKKAANRARTNKS